MTEDYHKEQDDGKQEPPTPTEQPMSKLLAEFGHLTLLFLRKLMLILWALLKLGLRQLLKYLCKGIILLWDLCILAAHKCKAFWNDNDTQAKVRLTKQWLKAATKAAGRGLAIALRQTGRGLVWLLKKTLKGLVWFIRQTIKAIIHLGPTLKALGHLIARLSKATWRLICKGAHAFARFCRRRRLAYKRFRQNKGFKGLLIDMGTWMKSSLNNYLDENADDDSTDTDEEAEEDSEARYMTDENTVFDKDSMGKSKVHTFGRGLYNAMKKIVDED